MNNVEVILSEMTLEEKVDLLHGVGMWRSCSNDRLNIPEIVMTDGTHGVRYNLNQIIGGMELVKAFYDVINPPKTTDSGTPDLSMLSVTHPATCFPTGSNVACSFDVDLMERMGEALAKECQSLGVNILLGPGINIRRTPLGGRGYEYYSEDPTLTAKMGAAMVNGLQKNGVGACVKHFAAYNSEYKRTTNDSIVSERALREIYLYAFEYIVSKTSPFMIMSSYNLLNGEQASDSKWLLKKVLRDEWKYDGVIVCDWMGIIDRIKSLEATGDLEMPEHPSNSRRLLDAVKQDKALLEELNNSCRRMLQLIYKAKKLEERHTKVDLYAHHMLAREIAEESIVLAKNEDNILPIKECKKLAVIGEGAVVPIIQGLGCATTLPPRLDSPLEKIKELAGEQAEIRYAKGVEVNSNIVNKVFLDEALNAAQWADTVIVFVNALSASGEEADASDMNLSLAHNTMVESILGVNPNVVAIVTSGEAVLVPWFDKVKAVLLTFFAGQAVGDALARILFGVVNPSGKTTVSFPQSLEETPAFLNYPGENGKHFYSEGIFVGYRYYNRRKIQPRLPFGFGLSYTTFSYDKMRISKATLLEGETLEIEVDITNTGSIFGKETVQLYIADVESTLLRPLKELKAFAKIALEPGERKTVCMQLESKDFCFYDPAYQEWIFETGEFEILVGKNEADICLSAKINAQAKREYNLLVRENMDIETFSKIPQAMEALINIMHDKFNMSREEIAHKIKHDLGILLKLNVRNALDVVCDIPLTAEEYSNFINEIREKQLALYR